MFDWITVILVLLIVGIVLDGIRRVRAAKKGSIKLSRNAKKADVQYGDDEELGRSEFPSGGARVVAYREEGEAKQRTKELKQSFVANRSTLGASSRIPEQVSLNLEESVPMLMESIEIQARKDSSELADPIEPSNNNRVESQQRTNIRDEKVGVATAIEASSETASVSGRADRNRVEEIDRPPASETVSERLDHIEPSIGSLDGLDAADEYLKEQSLSNVSENESCTADHQYYEDEFEEAHQEVHKKETLSEKIHKKIDQHFSDKRSKNQKAQDSNKKEYTEPDEVLIVNIMAPPGQVFAGEALLQALINEGLKLGDMDIFHRHYENNGDASIVFSLANMVMPGTFNLVEISEFSTPGVSLFLGLPVVGDSLDAYNDLVGTAQRLAQVIGGELKDENRSVMTKQTIEHGKQRVLEYERKKKLERV